MGRTHTHTQSKSAESPENIGTTCRQAQGAVVVLVFSRCFLPRFSFSPRVLPASRWMQLLDAGDVGTPQPTLCTIVIVFNLIQRVEDQRVEGGPEGGGWRGMWKQPKRGCVFFCADQYGSSSCPTAAGVAGAETTRQTAAVPDRLLRGSCDFCTNRKKCDGDAVDRCRYVWWF